MSHASSPEPEELLRFHREMWWIRLVEEGIASRYSDQEMRCPVHLSIGQEAAAVGVCQAIRPSDVLFSTHRSHAHYLAKGGDLRPMLAEIYGKAAGCLGGRGGSMHLMDASVGMLASVPIVGSAIPLAVGAALSHQLDGSDAVAVVFFGDAAVEEGVFHESANLASLKRLPVLFVCENNLYSIFTPLSRRQPDRPLTDLAAAQSMPAQQVDGNDVVGVHAATAEAVTRARSGGGPSFLQLDTYRWHEHCGPGFDHDVGWRTEEELHRWRERCPIDQLGRRLRELGLLSDVEEKAFLEEMRAEIAAAFEFARSAPLPDPSQAGDHIYA